MPEDFFLVAVTERLVYNLMYQVTEVSLHNTENEFLTRPGRKYGWRKLLAERILCLFAHCIVSAVLIAVSRDGL